MLQQTRVETVLGYYERFLGRFPGIAALAAARLEEVLELWAGLGYYARARQAHLCARTLVERHEGRFPRTARELERLPGIGPSTAAAIAAFCFGERAAILDGNVKRVLARYFAVDTDLRQAATVDTLWRHARALIPASRHVGTYTQAIMDLGATVCTRTRPRCDACPLHSGCLARAQGRAADLPLRTPSPARPVRRAHLLVVLHRGAVLLEQRPTSGIWGGLLSLPQFARREDLEQFAHGLDASEPEMRAARRHGFTHFTLSYTPHVLRARASRRPAAAAPARWLPLSRIDGAALPAPVLALLRDLRSEAGRHRSTRDPRSPPGLAALR